MDDKENSMSVTQPNHPSSEIKPSATKTVAECAPAKGKVDSESVDLTDPVTTPSTSSTPTSNAMSMVVVDSPESPRPRYVIERTDGTFTPLIAVDDLPSNIRITGVPKVMLVPDIVGMICLVDEARGKASYRIEIDSDDQTEGSMTSAHTGSESSSVQDQVGKVETGRTEGTVRGWRAKVEVDESNVQVMNTP